MSAEQLNAFLRTVAASVSLQEQLRSSDAIAAAAIAAQAGFDVTVGDLTRYKARATTWQLSDDELAVVAAWQPQRQTYWWQCIWDC
ncbi:MAG: Nif11-like leader peptide family RiPP precursor [Actinomycetes bacterium]